MARSPHAAGRARRSLVVSTGVGVVVAVLACGVLPAEGESGPASGSGAVTCPSPNPPNALTLMAGTPQTATLGSAFATNLQVTLTNSNGCPVTTAAGTPVTFSAPSDGASGSFSASGSSTVTVGADASGTVAAPTFTANDTAGSYTVTARSSYGSVSFSLTNAGASDSSACGAISSGVPSIGAAPATLAGRPTKLTAGVGDRQSTPAGRRFPIRFAVTVTDVEKNPVAGVLVRFEAPAHGPSGTFTASRKSSARSPTLRPRQVQVRTDACGIALAPAFTADHRAGGYIVVASVEHLKAAFALVNEGR